MANLCITVRSLKRADHLKRCLDSLSLNVDLDEVDFYFLQDGAVNPFSGIRYATDEEIKSSFRIFRDSNLPNKVIYKSNWNMGCALQKQHQLTSLFPRYDYVVLVDNDLVFNKYYVKTLKVLFEQFKNDKKAGILQTSFRHQRSKYQEKESAQKLERFVHYGFSHRWELGFWRESWEKIAPFMYTYFKLIRKCDFRELLYNPDVYPNLKRELHKVYGTLHADYAFEKSAIKAGYRGLHTMTLRHKTIGEGGMYSFRGDRFRRDGFDCIGLYDVGNIDKYERITILGG